MKTKVHLKHLVSIRWEYSHIIKLDAPTIVLVTFGDMSITVNYKKKNIVLWLIVK